MFHLDLCVFSPCSTLWLGAQPTFQLDRAPAACSKMLQAADRETRRGNWQFRNKLIERVIELKGKTLGIIGFGKISRRVAEIASSIGMNVKYYDPYVVERGGKFRKVGFEELLRTSDVISVHVPLTSGTHHLISERELGLMKNSVILVNTSGGL